jgi:hypothetical protein
MSTFWGLAEVVREGILEDVQKSVCPVPAPIHADEPVSAKASRSWLHPVFDLQPFDPRERLIARDED